MAILGLLLVLASGGLAVGLLLDNGSTTTVTFYGATYNVHTDMLFLAGIVTGLVFAIGLGLLFSGFAGARRRRRESMLAERDRERERRELEERNNHLENKLRERDDHVDTSRHPRHGRRAVPDRDPPPRPRRGRRAGRPREARAVPPLSYSGTRASHTRRCSPPRTSSSAAARPRTRWPVSATWSVTSVT